MANMTFNIGPNGRVVIDGCRGDVRVQGGDRATIEVSGDNTLAGRVSASNGELSIRNYNGDLRILAGPDATISGRRIAGDVSIERAGAVDLESVGGDLSAADVSSIRASEVGGDMRATLRDGSGEIGRVAGDLEVRNASSLQLAAVGGDAELLSIKQLAGLGRIGGDLRLEWSGQLAEEAAGSIGGDAQITVAPEANLVLRAVVGGDITGDGQPPTPRAEAHEAEDYAATEEGGDVHGWDLEGAGGELTMTFGSGGPELQLTIGGDLDIHGGRVTSSSFNGIGRGGFPMGDFGLGNEMKRLTRDLRAMGRGLARDFAREMRTSTRSVPGGRPRVHVQFNDKTFHFDADQIDRLTREAREAAASGIARAQEAVERALVNIASSSRAAVSSPSAPRPPEPPRAPNAPVPVSGYTGNTVRIEREQPAVEPRRPAEEVQAEKLAILRMVSEGRLGVDEAELMLRALEERG